MKRYTLCILFFSTLLCSNFIIHAMDDDFDLDFDDDPLTSFVNNIENLDSLAAPNRSCNVQDAYALINTLLQFIGPGAVEDFVTTLSTGIYRKTNIPHSRYIGDMPSFIWYYDKESFFSIEPFVNYTPRMRFTRDCEVLDAYVRLTDDNIVRIIKNVGNVFNSPTAAQALRLFAQFNLTEAKAGAMFQGRKTFGKWAFGAQLPLYYYLRHYNATEDIREDLKRFLSSFQGTEEPGQASGSTSKIKKLMVGDAWGVGALRLDTAWKILATDQIRWTIGGRATLDLHGVFGRGGIGSNFQGQPIPFLDFEELMCLVAEFGTATPPLTPAQRNAKSEAQTLTKDWAVDVLNWISQSLLLPSMGEDGHTSVGFFIEPHIQLRRQTIVKSRFNVDILFPKNGTRYLLAERDLQFFNADYIDAGTLTEEEASRRFGYLSDILQEKFAPDRACVSLGSRKKFEWSIAPYFRLSDNLVAHVGYDFWWIDGDSIKAIDGDFSQKFDLRCLEFDADDTCEEQATIPDVRDVPVNVEKALRGDAYQSKIFGGIEYRKFRERNDLEFSLAGDYTLGRRWIGDDWTVKLGITWRF